MSNLEHFEQLVATARKEVPPPVDVSASVLAAIQNARVERAAPVDRMAMGFAAASVLAESIVAMLAWHWVEEPVLAEVPNPFVVPVMGAK